MNWQILGHTRTNAISSNDSFNSGTAVSLTCQSCGRLILPLLSNGLAFGMLHQISQNFPSRRRNTCKECLQNFIEIDQELTEKSAKKHPSLVEVDCNLSLFSIHVVSTLKVSQIFVTFDKYFRS